MPRSSLDVRERLWIGGLQTIEPLATHDREPEIPEQLLVVLLADAVEVHNVAVQIIQHFHFGWLLAEKHLCAARECLHVCRVLRKYFNDPLRQSVLPTYVRNRSSHFLGSTKSLPRWNTSAEAHMPKRELQSNGLMEK
jgi:hypothetical protein